MSLAFIDLDCHRLPDRLVAEMFGRSVILLGLATVLGAGSGGQFGRAPLSAVVVLAASMALAASEFDEALVDL